MTDAIVSYVDGDKAAAKQALLSVILLNEKGALKVFVSALKQVPGIPQDLLTILSGEPIGSDCTYSSQCQGTLVCDNYKCADVARPGAAAPEPTQTHQVKEQPVKEIAQQALLGGSATKICSLTLLNSGSQEEDQHWVVDGLGKMETTTVSIFSTDKGCSIYFIGTPSTITRVFPQWDSRK